MLFAARKLPVALIAATMIFATAEVTSRYMGHGSPGVDRLLSRILFFQQAESRACRSESVRYRRRQTADSAVYRIRVHQLRGVMRARLLRISQSSGE